jgi:hypothetical protein
MKIDVITDAKGNIVATVQAKGTSSQYTAIAHPVPNHGHTLHTIDLPGHLESERDAERLHLEVRKLL